MNGMQDFSADDLLDQMEEMQNEIEQKDDQIKDQETQLYQLKKTDGEKDCEIQRLNAFITNLNKENEDALSKQEENRNKLEQDLKKERSRRQSLSETYQRVNSQYITLLQEHDRFQRRYKQDVSMAENRTKSAEYIMAQTQKDCNAANAALLQLARSRNCLNRQWDGITLRVISCGCLWLLYPSQCLPLLFTSQRDS